MKNNKGFGLTELFVALFVFLVCVIIIIFYATKVADDIKLDNNNFVFLIK